MQSNEYLIHKATGRVVRKDAKAYPSGELLPYTPPQFLRKVDGNNKGQLFPWTFYLSQRRDMMPFSGDPNSPEPLPESHRPSGKVGFNLDEAKVGDGITDDELLESNELHVVPNTEAGDEVAGARDENSENITGDETPEALGLLDQLCLAEGTTRTQEIVKAIGKLDVTRDFGGKGLPKMEALYNALDNTVGYLEMLEAWKIFKEQ